MLKEERGETLIKLMTNDFTRMCERKLKEMKKRREGERESQEDASCEEVIK